VLIAYLAGMARRPRVDFPGAFHHVYARGIEKRDIFLDRNDREGLRRRILGNLTRFNACCLAWAFMPNHFHLLYHSRTGNLVDFMRCLMSGYSLYFNRKYERVGHLFQNRYKSSVIDTERYLLELIRYIHLNPVRSGLVSSVETLSRYQWTGHYEIMASGRLPWEEYHFIREFFSSEYLPSVDSYLAFLGEGRCTRSGEFSFEETATQAKEMRGASIENSPSGDTDGSHRTFLDIVSKVSCKFAVSQDRILDGRRDRLSSLARREILKRCVMEKGMTRQSVCKWLGITGAGGLYLLKAMNHADANRSILTRGRD
jgi:REP element-mobilizing transposase RayT